MYQIDNTKSTSRNADIDAPGICAACGKKAYDVFTKYHVNSSGLKRCTGCYSVRYCGIACQKSHRKQHKKSCAETADKRRAFNDELLKMKLCCDVTPLPPRPDCDLCMHVMPLSVKGSKYFSCCGKIACQACFCRSTFDWLNPEFSFMNFCLNESSEKTCPFCRSHDDVVPIGEKDLATRERSLELRAEKGESRALLELAWIHKDGTSASAINEFTKR